MNLVFLGPPGVGKGTQAALVASSLGIAHISTGDLLRAAVKAGTKTGLEARGAMDAGRLVPDVVVNRLVHERLEDKDTVVGALFDGYPRTLQQAETLDQTLADLGRRIDMVLDFQAPDAMLIDRISGRRTCGKCHAAYHTVFAPPPKEGICGRCEGPLVQRTDDTAATVKKRLEVYRKDTAGVSDHYRKTCKFEVIAADRLIDAITSDVLSRVKGLK